MFAWPTLLFKAAVTPGLKSKAKSRVPMMTRDKQYGIESVIQSVTSGNWMFHCLPTLEGEK